MVTRILVTVKASLANPFAYYFTRPLHFVFLFFFVYFYSAQCALRAARGRYRRTFIRVRVCPYWDIAKVVLIEESSKMGVNSLQSESSNDLDEQISQLMQCKPLSEQQVWFMSPECSGSAWLLKKHSTKM